MNDLIPDGKETGGGSPNGSQPSCCQPAVGNGSSCCDPRGSSWGKGKALISLIIIIAAIGVGANSLLRGAATRTEAVNPASNCSPQCAAASGQSAVSKPGSCPAQCGATSSQVGISKAAACPTPCCATASSPSETSKPAASCPSQSGAAPCSNAGVPETATPSAASTSSSASGAKEITIFGKQSCPFTQKAREAKSKEGLTVIYKDVIENPQALAEMLRLTKGNRTVPVLVAGGQVSIGFGGF
jgi:glutaredoxin